MRESDDVSDVLAQSQQTERVKPLRNTTLDLPYPRSYETCIQFIEFLERKKWLKKVEGIYDIIPDLQMILEKAFQEQEKGFKAYLDYRDEIDRTHQNGQ